MYGDYEVMATGYNTDTKKTEIYSVVTSGPKAITMNVNCKDHANSESIVAYTTFGLTTLKCCEAYQAYHSNPEITIGEDPDLKYSNNGGYDPMSVKRYFPRGFKFYPLRTLGRQYNKPIPKFIENISSYIDNYYSKGPNRKEPFYICAYIEKLNLVLPMDIPVESLTDKVLEMDFDPGENVSLMVFRDDPNKIKKPIAYDFKHAIRVLYTVLETADRGTGYTHPWPHAWYYDIPYEENVKCQYLRSPDFKFYLVNNIKNPKWDTKMKVLSDSLREVFRSPYALS